MKAEVLPTDPTPHLKESVTEIVRALGSGDIVGLPTETVYGLGADAFRADAVAKIFEIKERPTFDPLIVHIESHEDISRVAKIPEGLEKLIRQLGTKFWPGPLTIILPKTDAVPDLVTAGLPTVAIRISRHPAFRKVIKAFGNPIAAPSANRFGRISPTSAQAVYDELGDRISYILDGGACAHGLESTIVVPELPERKGGKPILRIVRPGPILADDLKKYAIVLQGEEAKKEQDISPDALKSPGLLDSHYAPMTPLRLLDRPEDFVPEQNKKYALLSFRGDKKDGYLNLTDWEMVQSLSPKKGKLPEAAVRFFHILRQLDQTGVDEIIAEPIPERMHGIAIMDRLRKAASF